MKKVLITAGGTVEKIDSVRVLTNISSGKLGAKIAENFCNANYPDKVLTDEKVWVHGFHGSEKEMLIDFPVPEYKVYYLHSRNAVKPRGRAIKMDYNMQLPLLWSTNQSTIEMIEVNSVQEVYDKMEELIPEMDACIHSMAVSDFTFNRENPIKLKSNDADGFVEFMKNNIQKTPKIISKIKEWNPNIFLVGFKFEVGLDPEELIDVAVTAKSKYKGNIVVANDKEQMQKGKSHIAYICRNERSYYRVENKQEIAEALLKEIKERVR